jgi:lambda family phage portal protein
VIKIRSPITFGKKRTNKRRHVRARYDAAQTTANNREHWSQADFLAADAALSPEVRSKLRSRSRYEIGNNAWARHIMHTLVNMVIGCGPRLQLLGLQDLEDLEDDEKRKISKAIKRAWTDWSEGVGLTEKLWTARLSQGESGEAFLIFADDLTKPALEGLDLWLVEADQVTSSALYGSKLNLEGGEELDYDGVVVDRRGRPRRYYVANRHPGSEYGHTVDPKSIPARYVMHLFRRERPGQVRGIPELTASLELFALMRRYTLATVQAAEAAALHTGVLESDAVEDDEFESESDEDNEQVFEPDPMDEVALMRGQFTVLAKGQKLTQLKAEHPTTMYEAFMRMLIGEAAAPVHMPKNIALADSSSFNFASSEIDHLAFGGFTKMERKSLELKVLKRVFAEWWRRVVTEDRELAKAAARMRLDRDTPPRIAWNWDNTRPGDPVKRQQARMLGLKARTTTRAAIAAEDGLDWEDNAYQLADEEALHRRLGLVDEAQDTSETQDDPAIERARVQEDDFDDD